MTICRLRHTFGVVLIASAAALIGACAQGTKPLSQSETEDASGQADSGQHQPADAGHDARPQDTDTPDTGRQDTGPSCSATACTIGERICVGQSEIATCIDDGNGCGMPGTSSSCGSNMICSAGQCVQDTGACVDADGDGWGANCAAGPDCNDGNGNIHPSAFELCDGVDNDCDGRTDEDFGQKGQSCTVGQGACERTGTYLCKVDGSDTHCSVRAGTPGTELCGDGVDNDCDGQTDEGFNVGQSCTSGQGACQRSGSYECNASGTGTVCNATPGSVSAEVCDSVDNDCDGQVDEGGVCNTCTASMEICDGTDNDCDGQTDESMCYSCTDDAYEDNDSSGSATSLNSTLAELVMCGSSSNYDKDWYDLGTHNPGESITVTINQQTGTNQVGDAYPDLYMEFYCRQSLSYPTYCTNSGGSQITFDGHCGTSSCASGARWVFYVYPRSATSPAVGTPYSLTRN